MMLAIYGPTATGKTDLALELAKKYNGELISADSRQVYKGLDIGTGKIQPDHKVSKHSGYWIVDNIKINGFDLVEPEEDFSAFDFLKFARETISKINKENKTPIIVGGTGFYIKVLIDGIDSVGIPKKAKLRNRLEKQSVDRLYQELLKIDPTRAKSMNASDRANPRRLIRAIEIAVFESQESRVKSQGKKSGFWPLATGDYSLICLTAPNDYLYQRADSWLTKRLKHGMVEEIQDLISKGIDTKWLLNLGLEYRWFTKYLLGEIDKDTAIERLKGDIHSFIRRQKTWIGKFKNRQTFDISQKDWLNKLEKDVNLWYNRTNVGK